jgi:hypothetical protein
MAHTLKDFHKEIQGQDIYLIGGGRSFIPDKHIPLLPKDRVICLNSALEDFDKCLALMWMDGPWKGKNSRLVKEKRQKYSIHFTINNQILEPSNGLPIQIRNVSCGKCDYTVKREPYNVCGNNVGCIAIDLLDQLNAKTIYLLGFDCSEENGKSHYHDRYDRYVKQRTYDNNFIPCFIKLSKHIKNSNVINLSENTKIPCFKRANILNIINK